MELENITDNVMRAKIALMADAQLDFTPQEVAVDGGWFINVWHNRKKTSIAAFTTSEEYERALGIAIKVIKESKGVKMYNLEPDDAIETVVGTMVYATWNGVRYIASPATIDRNGEQYFIKDNYTMSDENSLNAAYEIKTALNRFGKVLKCATVILEAESDYDFSEEPELVPQAADIVAELRVGFSEEEEEAFFDTLNVRYDSGYGGQVLFGTLWFTDGTWADRGEYDGSEWWSLKEITVIPKHLR